MAHHDVGLLAHRHTILTNKKKNQFQLTMMRYTDSVQINNVMATHRHMFTSIQSSLELFVNKLTRSVSHAVSAYTNFDSSRIDIT